LARNIVKKHDINDRSFAHRTLVLLLHYLVKCRSWQQEDNNESQQWIHAGYRMPAQKIIVRPENHRKSVTSLTLIRSKFIVVRSESHGYWMCWRRVVQHLCTCASAGGGHFEHIL